MTYRTRFRDWQAIPQAWHGRVKAFIAGWDDRLEGLEENRVHGWAGSATYGVDYRAGRACRSHAPRISA